MKKSLLIIFLLASCQIFAQTEQKFSNCIKVEKTDSLSDIIDKAAHVVPTQRQYEWQKMEFTGFVHFGINTFTGREWGTGKETPEQFAPQNINPKQWVAVAKSAGIKMVMLTAKHHDGFCLWQTQTTPHSVKNSPWKHGKGDVLKELADAAKAENMKVGVYLSPADLHEIERKNGTYGNGSKPRMRKIPTSAELVKKGKGKDVFLSRTDGYNTSFMNQPQKKQFFSFLLDDYNTLFMNQLYEVLTKYGEISEVWFDGANPKAGTGQTYNYQAWYSMIRQLQPNAVIAIKGPDVRWIGNEGGHSRSSEWSVLPLAQAPEKLTWKDRIKEDLGSRTQLKDAKYLYWYPAETDVPIRKGWFYRDEQQPVKTVDELLDIWYRSVGNNSVLLLNISPNREGVIPQKDAQRMRQLGEIIRTSFQTNLLEDSNISDKTHLIFEEIDDKTKVHKKGFSTTYTLKKPQTFNRIVIQENIKESGQRIEKFIVEIWANDKWTEIYRAGAVGYKHIGRFPMQKAKKIRLKLLEYRNIPNIEFVGLYKAPELLSTPQITRTKNGVVSMHCKTPDPAIYYTLDGSPPTQKSLKYTQPFALPKGGPLKAIATIQNGKQQSNIQEVTFDICPAKWQILAESSAAKGFEADKAIDGKANTLWHTPWDENCPKFPHSVTIDLGEKLKVCGMTYLPRQDGSLAGICTEYKIQGSKNGKRWKTLAKGSFDNIKNNPVLQQIKFRKKRLRFIRFIGLKSVNDKPYLSVAELGILTK